MARQVAIALSIILTGSMLAAATPAGAVIKGKSSSLGRHTVRLVGNGYCSGVAIARRAVATAAHCAEGMYVLAGGRAFRVSAITRSAVLDDGRQVSVSGDAAILKLAAPLPASVEAAPVGEGEGDSFTIAGYGSGTLREATLVAAEPRALVDPKRTGSIGASACFGDSGGPVLRGGMLVGVITRAAHPSPRIACGHLTRWAAITASGEAGAVAVAAVDDGTTVAEPRSRKVRRHAKRPQANETSSANWFSGWFTAKVETHRVSRRKSAQR